MNYLGIDPGKLGGFCLLNESGGIEETHKMPMIGKEYDMMALSQIFELSAMNISCNIFIETGIPMPGLGSKQSWGNGYSHGVLHMAASFYGFELIRSQDWQKGIPGRTTMIKGKPVKLKSADWKKRLIAYAIQLEPSLPKHSGICDAYLIARYGRMKYLGMK